MVLHVEVCKVLKKKGYGLIRGEINKLLLKVDAR